MHFLFQKIKCLVLSHTEKCQITTLQTMNLIAHTHWCDRCGKTLRADISFIETIEPGLAIADQSAYMN